MGNPINQKPDHTLFLLLIIAIFTLTVTHAQDCIPSGSITGTQAPPDKCNPNEASCCQAGSVYQTYTCSPPVSGQTAAVLTLNSFEEGGDGGDPPQCDEQFHSDDTLVVALSTGWYDNRSRCGRDIVINGNGQSVRAKVVDECDSTAGCDMGHGFQVPCRNNVVDGSRAVWDALGVDPDSPEYGEIAITWSDA